LTESLKKRIKTAFIIGLPILFLVFFNDTTRVLFLVLLLALTVWEFLNLHYRAISENAAIYLITTGLVLTITTLMFVGVAPKTLIFFSIIPTILLTLDLFQGFVNRNKRTAWLYSLLYAAIPIIALLTLHGETYFRELLVGSLLLIWISDIAAYFVGKSIGKHKLMPSISPGKTREGFFGAGMITILSSYLLYNFLGHFTFQQWAIIALLVWLLGSIGDLVESKMKRQLNIKDSGNILPGHGGFLDRFDGFIFCLPAVSIFAYYIS